ncbi:MAG: ABC transporter permease, partial [Actinomycetes bacterium]
KVLRIVSLVQPVTKIKSSYLILILIGVWSILALIFKGVATLEIPTYQNSIATQIAGDAASSIRGNRTKSAIFIYFFNPIRLFINGFVDIIRMFIATPVPGSIIPVLGWLGVIGLVAFLVYLTSNLKTTILASLLLFGCGLLGMWTDTMDTLAMTIAAVILSLLIGIPLGIWAGLSDRVLRILTPFLDLAQILPTLVYLAPLALFFLIGQASATIATMVYSIPLSIRITSHAIRSLNHSPVEASISMGSTTNQTLTKVQLPMSKQMIVLGINQTVMAALSFVVIAALIAAPGLGKPIVTALTIRNVGDGFVAGLAVVFLAILLDRSTSAAAKTKVSYVPPTKKEIQRRRLSLVLMGVFMMVSIWLSRNILWAAVWPKNLDFSKPIANITNSITDWIVNNFQFFTVGFKDLISNYVLNNLQLLLAGSPWFITVVMLSLLAYLIGGLRVTIVAIGLMVLIISTGLWYETMVTLTQTIVATMLTMIVGLVLGIWIGRSQKADKFLRPFLDAGQTLPAFVYLVPMLGLFGPTRFTAIATGIVYSIPIVVKIVGEGIRNVSSSMVEAATSSGSTAWQIITKVQIPAAKRALLLAVNQGLIFVLAVVVIGGYVGAGALGYLVIVGNSKPELQGKGLVAGLCIVLLGIMIDRIAQAGARKYGN